MHEAIFSLGSNLGDRLAHLRAARAKLAALPNSHLVASAPIYETEPVEVPREYRGISYLNTIVVLATELAPEILARNAHDIETELGRIRGPERNAPRPIDIDLIACGDAVRNTPELTLPHPRALNRLFVCRPLADVRPGSILPGNRDTTRAILATLPQKPVVTLVHRTW